MAQNPSDSDLASVREDVQSLKRDVAALLTHLKSNATSTADDALSTITAEARSIYDNLAARGQRSADAVSQHVEEQPLMSLLIAFGVGFVSGRLLSR